MAAPTITTGILTGGSNNHETTSEEANAVATDFVSEGVVGTFTNTSGVAPATGAFAVNASGTPDANINVSTGVAYVSATPTSQNAQSLRVKCTVTGTLAISANASGSTKYDWIYISVSASNAANPAVGADNVATIVASRSSSASTDDGTPPTYGYPIAVVTVANGFSTITNGNIRDVRTNCIVNLGSSSVSSGWTDLGYTPNTVTANGNRSYSLVFNSTDLTGTLSPGMRLKTTRLVTAPTTCFSLDGSNDYYNDTTVSGMTFTDDFVAGAWVYLTSYALGTVIGRYNGTSGWYLEINANGQVQLLGNNAGSANYRGIRSYQSIPLNKWVHIAAQEDMSAHTNTSTTCYVMIDGVNVPAEPIQGGTNPTSIPAGGAGNLEVGAKNAGTNPFPGYIDQAFVSSAKITQANVQTIISQAWTAALVSTHSVISAYSNGSTTDINTTNANNLTAQNGATTASRSPFSTNSFGTAAGTTDYAIITSSTFSTNTTLVVQVPEANTIPTSGGVSAVSYSTQKAPYGMPVDSARWALKTVLKTSDTQSSPAGSTWYNPSPTSGTSGGNRIILPVGVWETRYETVATAVSPGATGNVETTLSTGASTESSAEYTARSVITATAATVANWNSTHSRSGHETLSAQTTYYLNVRSTTAGLTSIGLLATTGATTITATPSYL